MGVSENFYLYFNIFSISIGLTNIYKYYRVVESMHSVLYGGWVPEVRSSGVSGYN